MKIQCENCGIGHELDPPAWVISSGRPFRFRCSSCGHSQMVSASAGASAATATAPAAANTARNEDTAPTEPRIKVTAPMPPPGTSPSADAPVPAPAPGEPPPVYLKQDGKVYLVRDWATVQRWIMERRVERSDLVSEGGVRWEPIGTRPELGSFFAAVEQIEAAEQAGLASGTPAPAPYAQAPAAAAPAPSFQAPAAPPPPFASPSPFANPFPFGGGDAATDSQSRFGRLDDDTEGVPMGLPPLPTEEVGGEDEGDGEEYPDAPPTRSQGSRASPPTVLGAPSAGGLPPVGPPPAEGVVTQTPVRASEMPTLISNDPLPFPFGAPAPSDERPPDDVDIAPPAILTPMAAPPREEGARPLAPMSPVPSALASDVARNETPIVRETEPELVGDPLPTTGSSSARRAAEPEADPIPRDDTADHLADDPFGGFAAHDAPAPAAPHEDWEPPARTGQPWYVYAVASLVTVGALAVVIAVALNTLTSHDTSPPIAQVEDDAHLDQALPSASAPPSAGSVTSSTTASADPSTSATAATDPGAASPGTASPATSATDPSATAAPGTSTTTPATTSTTSTTPSSTSTTATTSPGTSSPTTSTTAPSSGTSTSSTAAASKPPATTAAASDPKASAPVPTSKLVDKGWEYLDKNNLSAAASSFEKALSQSPDSNDANYGYGYTLLKQGQKDAAQKHLCRALKGADATTQRDVNGLLQSNGLGC